MIFTFVIEAVTEHKMMNYCDYNDNNWYIILSAFSMCYLCTYDTCYSCTMYTDTGVCKHSVNDKEKREKNEHMKKI